ncbi:transcriptional repressor [Anaerocolumna sp. AGMB13025]|uniref:Fur family transcriptional regulator n=1 Tax=Anaerocolumna sp. AGMB13025 TaxID=3039116 RepID=UPI00241F46D1|nr:transcriptional repressor [Anaerocolumna sp. AGMB13025]WFR56745.1 transcriptional repressor [Anaerocolumna sp. AGMB13025]
MQKNYRTKSRDRILMFFKNHKEQTVSAARLHEYLQEQDNKVNLATIYRNLDRMTEDGVLIKYMDSQEDKAVYQYIGDNDNCHEHLHMKCMKCGKVTHLECSFMKEIMEHLQLQHKFALQCRKSILYGLCDNCIDKKQEI